MPSASRVPSRFEPLTAAIESASLLDTPATWVTRAARAALSPGRVKDALSGTWLGHPLHPVLTDVVIGTFLSASLLDLLGIEADAPATRRLLTVGIAAYAPTAATGISDWLDGTSDEAVKRVGIVHAVGNAAALSLYVASLRARRRGDTATGVVLAAIGGAGLGVGAFLGGHLAFRQGIGPDQTRFDPGPEEWTQALEEHELELGTPRQVIVGDTPVLLYWSADGFYAIHDRCSHRGCSLAEGEIDGHEVICGCHLSRFDLRDGALLRGPATAPQPAYEVRRREGRIEIRLAAERS